MEPKMDSNQGAAPGKRGGRRGGGSRSEGHVVSMCAVATGCGLAGGGHGNPPWKGRLDKSRQDQIAQVFSCHAGQENVVPGAAGPL